MNIKDIKGLKYIGKIGSHYEYRYIYRGIRFYVYTDLCDKAIEVVTYLSPNHYPIDNSSAHFSKRTYYKLYRKDRLEMLKNMISYNFKYMFECGVNVFHNALWRTIKYQFSYLKMLIKY